MLNPPLPPSRLSALLGAPLASRVRGHAPCLELEPSAVLRASSAGVGVAEAAGQQRSSLYTARHAEACISSAIQESGHTISNKRRRSLSCWFLVLGSWPLLLVSLLVSGISTPISHHLSAAAAAAAAAAALFSTSFQEFALRFRCRLSKRQRHPALSALSHESSPPPPLLLLVARASSLSSERPLLCRQRR